MTQDDVAFDKTSNTGFSHFINAARFSIKGLKFALRNESAFRQELVLLALALPAAFWLAQSWFQFSLLVCSIVFVIVVELLNSAIEAIVDRVGREHHPLSGVAKDLGSAAVMVSLLMAGMLWVGVVLDRVFV